MSTTPTHAPDRAVAVLVADGGPPVDLPDDRGLPSLVDGPAAGDPGRVVFALVDGTPITAARYRDDVDRAAARLVADGLAPGERVAILGLTSYAWAVADLAVLTAGGVVVPVYPTSSPTQIRHILADSGAVAALADSDERCAALDAAGPCRTPARTLDGLLAPAPVPDADTVAALDRRRAAVRADDLATIVYTSGTTGIPRAA